jgi:ring-1,2-phenylacetyl-CoA epoxidase subunit PaaC
MSDPRIHLALRMGDNSLILAQQNSKWCGHAPTLEEDIALANVSLDLMGHAQMWLGFAAETEGFRNSLLVERPNVDFATTLMRQYLFDVWHLEQLLLLSQSSDTLVAEISQKALVEVRYHRERSQSLVIRLGDGTIDSHNRMQEALNALWSYFGSFFEDSKDDELLFDLQTSPMPSSLYPSVLEQLNQDCVLSTLKTPESEFWQKGAVQGHHTENLGYILAEMQYLQRTYPNSKW